VYFDNLSLLSDAQAEQYRNQKKILSLQRAEKINLKQGHEKYNQILHINIS
jgi:hypothetical protein